MRSALDRGELTLVYHPIVRLIDNQMIGAEALLRWDHPTLGTVLPNRFIDLAGPRAAGWFGFYWGKPPAELRRSGTIGDALTLGWLDFFAREAPARRRP